MKAELRELAVDLTKLRTEEVSDDTEIVDPTIACATHTIAPARVQLGRDVRIRKRVRIEPGDLVFSRLHTQNGAFAYADSTYLATSTFVPLDVDDAKVDRRYLFWALHHIVPTMATSDSVGRETYKTQDILGLGITLPDRAEQERYGRACDHANVIAQRANELALEAGSDAALVVARARERCFQEATTPRRKLGEAVLKRTGFAYRASEFLSDGPIPVVRIKDISTQEPEVFLAEATGSRHVWLESGDIVLAKTSYSTGTMCMWDGPPAVLNQNAVMLRAQSGLEQRYVFHWLRYQVDAYLSAHLADPDFYPYIREGDLMRWEIPVPSPSAQRDIADHLDELSSLVQQVEELQHAVAASWRALPDATLGALMRPVRKPEHVRKAESPHPQT